MVNTEGYFQVAPIHTMKELIDRSTALYGDKVAFKYWKEQKQVSKTYSELKEDSDCFGSFFTCNSFSGEKVALIGSLSYLWMVSYIGVVNSGGVAIIIDKELSAENISEYLRKTDTHTIICEDRYFDKIREINASDTYINKVFCLEKNRMCDGVSTYSISEILNIRQAYNHVTKRDMDRYSISTIVFTSGTTGNSKGVMLSQENICSNVIGGLSLVSFQSEDTALSVLPINHMYELTCGILILLYSGVTICINGELKDLIKNMQVFKPTVMFLVPLFLISFLKQIKREKLDKKAVIELFGGRLRKIIVGGAPVQEAHLDSIREYGIQVLQGFGITECSPLVSVNGDNLSKRHSVGKVIDGSLVKISEGEILVKGPGVMLGYYGEDTATDEAFDGEWFKTGDLGWLDEDNFLYINGRKKRLILLDNGENVNPEELENRIGQWYLVAEVMVSSKEEKSHSFIAAEIYPDYQMIHTMNQEENYKTIIEEKLKEMNQTLPKYKQIKKIIYRNQPFKKTSTNKIIV